MYNCAENQNKLLNLGTLDEIYLVIFWNRILDILLRMELFTNTMFWQVLSTEDLTFSFNSPFKSSQFYVFDP